MSFYAIQIAQSANIGWVGGPEFSTTVQALASGVEKRNVDWAICRHKYSVPYSMLDADSFLAIKNVFLICRGRGHTFLHRDLADFRATDEPFGTGDGTTTTFQLSKTSTLGGTSATYQRIITKPAAGVVVKVNGAVTGAQVDTTSGTVTFAEAPASGAVLTWTGTFFVHVRFDLDYLPFSLVARSGPNLINESTIDLIEVLGENESAT